MHIVRRAAFVIDIRTTSNKLSYYLEVSLSCRCHERGIVVPRPLLVVAPFLLYLPPLAEFLDLTGGPARDIQSDCIRNKARGCEMLTEEDTMWQLVRERT